MLTVNRFGEPVHRVDFPDRPRAMRFTKMLGRNPRCFSLVGSHRTQAGWSVFYRARKESPWLPDHRATWPQGVH